MPKKVPLVTPYLNALSYNPSENLYEIKEGGVLYSMSLELVRSLNDFMKRNVGGNEDGPIATWYSTLTRHEKRRVIRSGKINNEDTGFYPDIEFD